MSRVELTPLMMVGCCGSGLIWALFRALNWERVVQARDFQKTHTFVGKGGDAWREARELTGWGRKRVLVWDHSQLFMTEYGILGNDLSDSSRPCRFRLASDLDIESVEVAASIVADVIS